MRRCATIFAVVGLVGAFAIAPAPPASALSSPLSSINFGSVTVGHHRSVAIPITLDAGYTPFSIAVTGTGYGVSLGNCGSLPTGPATCDMGLTFTPTSSTSFPASLTIAEKNGASVLSIGPLPVSGTGSSSALGKGAAHWGIDIARGVALTSFGDSGFTLDGFGGLHGFALTGVTAPAPAHGGPYWPGWNIARGVALLPNDTGGYVLDAYGGLHPFGVGGNAAPPAAQHAAYWPHLDIARGVTLTEDGTGGYVIDAYGGLHRFSVGGNPLPPLPTGGPYWPGFKIARGVTLHPLGGGYVLDGFGGVHRFATHGVTPPALSGTPHWPGYDIARGIDYSPATGRATVIDGFGGLHISA
jgi:hypothetical protein